MTRPLVVALLVLLATERYVHANDVDLFRDKVYVVSAYAFKGIDQSPKTEEGLVDLREYLEARNIKLPATGLAIYDPEFATVTVRAPREVIERLDLLWRADYPIAARISFILVEFSLDESITPVGMAYEELKKAAGNSWRILDRRTIVVRSGYKVTSDLQGKRSPPAKGGGPGKQKDAGAASWPNPLSTFGSNVEAEVQIGESAADMYVTFVYQYHSRAAGETPEVSMSVHEDVTLLHNVPLIVHTATVNPPQSDQAKVPGKEFAVIAHAIVEDALGRSLSPKRIGPSSASEYSSPFRLLPGNAIGPFPAEPKPRR